MDSIWTDPRFAWVAFGAGAFATCVAAVVFAALVWWITSRAARETMRRVELALQQSGRVPLLVAGQHARIDASLVRHAAELGAHHERLRAIEEKIGLPMGSMPDLTPRPGASHK